MVAFDQTSWSTSTARRVSDLVRRERAEGYSRMWHAGESLYVRVTRTLTAVPTRHSTCVIF